MFRRFDLLFMQWVIYVHKWYNVLRYCGPLDGVATWTVHWIYDIFN